MHDHDPNAGAAGAGRFLSSHFRYRRGDSGLRLIADRTIASLYRSGEIEGIYKTWFGGARPGPILRSLYMLQAIPER